MPTDEDPVVLIVEDEPDVAAAYRHQLEGDYSVRVAEGGEEALDMLAETVDVVLLDRRMPDVSGDAVLSAIRDRELDCRVAMVTAVDPDVDVLEMGFDAYLTKPVSEATLRETVEQLLERSAYDSLLQEYYALVEKRATLESSMSEAALGHSTEYRRLQDDIESMRAELGRTMGGVADDDDFITTVRRLSDR